VDIYFFGARYKIKCRHFIEHRGSALLHHFQRSPYKIVVAAFPNYKFLPWLFSRVPSNYWKEIENRRDYVKWLVHKVGLAAEGELQQVHFLENDGAGLLKLYNYSPLRVINSLKIDSASQVADLPFLSGRKPTGFYVLLIIWLRILRIESQSL
jgi:hypothetical protein